MTECYVLIDYENVQPPSLDSLKGDHWHILVFIGARQPKLPTAFAASLQRFGNRAQYVQVTATGKNMLDFHIFYYLGRLTEKHPSARFRVLAKDKGYDRLFKHLKQRSIDCGRCADVREIEGSASSNVPTPKVKALADRVIENLAKRKQAKPATEKTLTNTIRRLLGDISESDLKSILNTLEQRRVIKFAGEKVTYRENL